MTLISINPSNAQVLAEFEPMAEAAIEQALQRSRQAQVDWAARAVNERAAKLQALAARLREKKPALARQICREMGKLLSEAEAEVEKCAVSAEYYAAEAETMLRDEVIASDARRSLVALQPLGTVLAIMPWNFPLWQVMRCAIPALLAGNSVLLKHSSNSQLVAKDCEELMAGAGFPEHLFQNLVISSQQVAALISDQRVHAVSVTGSESAGRAVAAVAGANLKKCVLELGGSDPFVVLDDAKLETTVTTALQSRFMNCGQSCIAAKRFIVTEAIADKFVDAFHAAILELQPGDPMLADTRLAPMAREDLRQELDKQVQQSLAKGGKLICGGKAVDRPGYYYAASLLDQVTPGMAAYQEEIFGPVASIIRVKDARQALQVANDTRFGLGGSVWSQDLDRAEAFARQVQSGAVFVNGLVKSDARLPFGGIKASGYGRELSLLGLREFCNQKTLWVGG